MNTMRTKQGCCLAVFLGLLAAGCSTPSYTTSSYHPGPVAGRAVGTGVGVVAGNAAGFVVGTGEGLVQGATAPFDTTTHVVRRWRTETTADGRTIQVAEDILVDSQGRPVNAVAPAPAPAAPANP
ncbi:MAG: flagellar motor protein MotB [bacterium]